MIVTVEDVTTGPAGVTNGILGSWHHLWPSSHYTVTIIVTRKLCETGSVETGLVTISSLVTSMEPSIAFYVQIRRKYTLFSDSAKYFDNTTTVHGGLETGKLRRRGETPYRSGKIDFV